MHISDGMLRTECGRLLQDVKHHILPKDLPADETRIAICKTCVRAYTAWRREFEKAFGKPIEAKGEDQVWIWPGSWHSFYALSHSR